jgi:hypothetical protein
MLGNTEAFVRAYPASLTMPAMASLRKSVKVDGVLSGVMVAAIRAKATVHWQNSSVVEGCRLPRRGLPIAWSLKVIFPRRRGQRDYAASAAVWDLNSNDG